MRILRSLAFVAIVASTSSVASAQRTGTVELGGFGHFTMLDDDVLLGKNSFGAGARLGLFVQRYVALELEYGFGTLEDNARDASIWLPFRGLVIGNIGVSPRVKLLLGAGYKMDTWKGDSTDNEFEDGMSLLGGLRICMNNGWSLRPEVVYDRNPSPNFQNTVLGTSRHIGLRFGISKFFGRGSGSCERPEGAAPPPPPPAVTPRPATPPPAAAPPPPPAPTANLSASPATIAAGSSAMLIWTSTNAQRCNAPWTQSTASSGSQSVSPATTTSYTITCTGAGGTANAPITVNVTPRPVTPPPAAAPPPAAPAPRVNYRLEGVNFDLDQSVIKPEGRVKLDSAVTVMQAIPDIRIEIQGHTDSLATEEYNNALSLRRANAARDYLVARGIAASRITVRGFGESQPIADNGTEAGRAQNRRVMVVEVRN